MGIGVLLDHARTRDGSPKRSKEGDLLDELQKTAKRRGITIDRYPLVRPDIIAYLDPEEIRREAPHFPGFGAVEKRWGQPPRNTNFKTLASELAGGFQFTRTTIRELAERTWSNASLQPNDLAEVLAALAEAARRPPVDGVAGP